MAKIRSTRGAPRRFARGRRFLRGIGRRDAISTRTALLGVVMALCAIGLVMVLTCVPPMRVSSVGVAKRGCQPKKEPNVQ